MWQAIISLALPILVVGALTSLIPVRQQWLRLILTFSAGYLFSLALIHMLPDVFGETSGKLTGLFVVLGFCIQLFIDSFSTGIEHGHVHLHSHSCEKHLPWGIVIGLLLHSFLEGLPVYEIHNGHGDVNYSLILGLTVHNIPISIAFVSLLKEHESRRASRTLLLVLFAIMAPLGYLASYILQTVGFGDYEEYSRLAYAVVTGIFLHISTSILFEASVDHKYNLRKTAVMAAGIVLAYMIS